MSESLTDNAASTDATPATPESYEEFEVGENQIPWFLWLFFILIISWAAISWIPFVGY